MKSGALILMLAAIGMLPCPALAAGPAEHVRGCMTPEQARDTLIAERLVAPFRAFGEAKRANEGDVVGLQLCRMNDDFVYDVTLLRRDGHVTHTLVNARSGTPLVIRTGK